MDLYTNISYHHPIDRNDPEGALSDQDVIQTPSRLKNLRQRAGLSMREMAEAMGLKGPSSYQAYEGSYRYSGSIRYLPMEYLGAVTVALLGRGEPPILEGEIGRLFGIDGPVCHQARPWPITIHREAVAEAERYVALASPINAAPKDIVRHLFVNILGLAVEAGDVSGDR